MGYVDFFFDSNPKLRQLSQLYIEEILVLMCKFGGYDYTILLQYARVITSRGWNYERLSNAAPLLMHKKNGLSGNNFGQSIVQICYLYTQYRVKYIQNRMIITKIDN